MDNDQRILGLDSISEIPIHFNTLLIPFMNFKNSDTPVCFHFPNLEGLGEQRLPRS